MVLETFEARILYDDVSFRTGLELVIGGFRKCGDLVGQRYRLLCFDRALAGLGSHLVRSGLPNMPEV